MDSLFSFLAGLDSAGQEAFLRKQTPANLISLDRTYGYGACECDCPAIPIPCKEHALSRPEMIARAEANGFQFADLGGLSDKELFGRAWADIPGWRKKTRCDCPTLWQPCKHALAYKLGETLSPLTDEAKLVLLQLVNQVEQVEPAEALEGNDAGTRETKSVGMAKNLASGFAPQSEQDFLTRVVRESEDRIERDPCNGPNGQPDPGPVRLKMFDPSKPTFRKCVCGEALEGADSCPDCTRAREAMAKTMARKKRKKAV